MSDETKPDTSNPDKPEEQKPAGDGGTFRRPLIRASLPHPDGAQASQREAPVFTMHEQPPRGNNWGKGGRGGSNGNGNVQAKKHGRRRGGHGRNANDQWQWGRCIGSVCESVGLACSVLQSVFKPALEKEL